MDSTLDSQQRLERISAHLSALAELGVKFDAVQIGNGYSTRITVDRSLTEGPVDKASQLVSKQFKEWAIQDTILPEAVVDSPGPATVDAEMDDEAVDTYLQTTTATTSTTSATISATGPMTQGIVSGVIDYLYTKFVKQGREKNVHERFKDRQILEAYYMPSSDRERAKTPEMSDIFNTKGKFRPQFRYLEVFVNKNALTIPYRQTSKISGARVQRSWNKWGIVNSKLVYTGFFDSPDDATRIIIGFTRASSHPPCYRQVGMWQRGKAAVSAYVDLLEPGLITKISVARTRASSRQPWFNFTKDGQKVRNTAESKMTDLFCVLDAVQSGCAVDLVIVRIDGLTTHKPSLVWLAEAWPDIAIRLVFVVPAWFPHEDVFTTAANGIRYGTFELSGLSLAWGGQLQDRPARILQELFDEVNDGKTYVDMVENLSELTKGRANFRVHPSTTNDSGIDDVSAPRTVSSEYSRDAVKVW